MMSKYEEMDDLHEDLMDQQLEEEPLIPGDQTDLSPEDEVEAMKKRVKEMENEVSRLRNLNNTEGEEEHEAPTTEEEKAEIDSRSIYVGNVDYAVTPQELQDHFKSCGGINRITILSNKHTGSPKGYAYVEFADPSLVANALVLNESILHGRSIKVLSKRTNIPGYARGGFARGMSRGRGYRGSHRGGRHRGSYRGRRGGYVPY